ncbi:chemotaxis protein CheW [soil metagenome]|nr:chemotaxis protein CheW [Gemmatimonadota bacterium]
MRKLAPSVPHRQLVAFRIGDDEFGLDVSLVHEILRHQPVRSVPRAPAFVEGVIDLRGSLVPVIDLRRRFEIHDPSFGSDTRIMVINHRDERLGVIVDTVTEVLRVPESAFSEPPAYVRGLAAEYLQGVIRMQERMVVVLDMDRILSSDERIALEELDLHTHAPPVEASAGGSSADGTTGDPAQPA